MGRKDDAEAADVATVTRAQAQAPRALGTFADLLNKRK